MRIGLFAHVGNGNLGDEATVAALVQNIRERRPESEICVFSANPEDTERRHRIRAVPIRREAAGPRQARPTASAVSALTAQGAPAGGLARLKRLAKSVGWAYAMLKALARAVRALRGIGPETVFLARSFRVLRRVDRLIIAGGGQLGDYFGGPWGYPLAIFKWCLLARMAGAKIAFVSVGAEPVRSPVSKRLLRWALGLADYCSFRDEGSMRLLESIGARTGNRVCPDLVHSFRLSLGPPAQPGGSSGLIVGVNPIPFFDRRYWTEHDEAIYQRYVATLAAFASSLLGRGHRVLFFPTQIHADPLVIRDIELAMKRTGIDGLEDRIMTPLVASFENLGSVLLLTDVVVASRFHGIIFSFLCEKPVFALSYYRKTEELMRAMDQADYVLSIRNLDIDSLIGRFALLERNLMEARGRIIGRRRECLATLDSQYDAIFR
jgi:polysaccharide pyruvyl transferase WcaK-like protein